MIVSGSVSTFCSKITLPASSTTHTDVSFTDTSRPTKYAISSLLPRCRGRTDLDPLIVAEGAAHSASKAGAAAAAIHHLDRTHSRRSGLSARIGLDAPFLTFPSFDPWGGVGGAVTHR